MELILYGVYKFLQIYYYIMIACILLSWIPEVRSSKFYAMLNQITDPYLRLFRGLLIVGNFDLTPILGLMLYQFGLGALASVVASF